MSNRKTREGAFAIKQSDATTALQSYLNALAGDTRADSIIRTPLDRAMHRLERLSANMPCLSYPRPTHPPLNLQRDEMLAVVLERRLKAVRAVRRRTPWQDPPPFSLRTDRHRGTIPLGFDTLARQSRL